MIADRHYWSTADGRFVETGHTEAATLAYAKGDELPDDVACTLGLLEDEKPKQAPVPATKARKPADK